MKAYEILQHLPDDAAGEVFQHLYENDKPAYKACLQLLASRRKLRPVILERKSRAERHVWLRTELSRRQNEDATTEVLQTWLLGGHKALVCEFLDELGVAHNGHGLLETLPVEPAQDKLQAAIDHLFEKHPAPAVYAYLHLFADMDIADWPALKEILAADARFAPPSQLQTA